MQGYMNITVRVIAARAQAQIKALQAQVAGLEKQLAGASTGMSGFAGDKHISAMAKWGNQVQWTGRQISYNFTLPLAIAAGAAVKWQLANEKAFTQVQKVYGDTQAAAAFFQKSQKGLTDEMANQKATDTFNKELEALQKNFIALSNYYGVNQAEVTNVAAAWAQAGASGKELAIATDATMKAIILGDMDSAAATQALISIQAQYSLSSTELMKVLAQLNAVENQTGVSMQGLIAGFERAAGSARSAGIDTRNLAAMIAALVPATGSAENAGNALKTILSRLMAPTKQSTAVMKEMGLNIDDLAWKSANGSERLKLMSDAFMKLDDSGKTFASSIIASRWQVNKFDVLMRELASSSGFYAKALQATSSETKVFQIANKELQQVLTSNPRRLSIIWTTLQNASANIVQPLIPYILWLADTVKSLVQAFANLPGPVQKMIGIFALMLAMFGPLLKYFGATATLIGQLGLLFGRFAAGPLRAAAAALGVFRLAFSGLTAAWGYGVGIMVRGIMLLPGAVIASAAGMLKAFGVISTVVLRIAGLPIARAKFWLNGWVAMRVIFTGFILSMRLGMAQLSFILGALPVIMSAVIKSMVTVLGSNAVGNAIAGMLLWISRLGTITGPLTGIWVRAGMAWERIWGAMYTAFMLTFGILPRVTAAITAGIAAIWAMLGPTLLVIQASASAKIVAAYAFLEARIGAAFVAIRATALAVWASMNTGLIALAVAPWKTIQAAWAFMATWMRALWFGLQFSLVKAVAFFRTGTLAIWATLRSGWMATLVWMRTAGIAMFGSMAVTMRTVLLTALSPKAIGTALLTGLKRIGPMLLRALTGTVGLVVAAIITVLVLFRTQLQQIWQNIADWWNGSNNALVGALLKAWYALPTGITNALVAVAKVVAKVAMQVYEWLSYLNPFARHSPSLVDNVTNGVAVIQAQFGKLSSVGANITSAYSAIQQFNALVKTLGLDSFSQDLADIKKNAPSLAAGFTKLHAILGSLNTDLAAANVRVNTQTAVVAKWQTALDKANASLDAQQAKLDALQKIASNYSDKLDAAQQRLSDFASAPIAGMGAMEDAIFANDQAQKKLQLAMMKMEDVTGPLDDIKSKIDAITGAQELLRGEQANLRAGGAGSEILKGYDDQIAKLEKQKGAYSDSANKLQTMQDALDKLQRTADRLDLEKSLKFDPLTRAIEKASSAMKEMPFDQIMAGITSAKSDINKYTGALDLANKAVTAQQAVVDQVTAARDALSTRLDTEKKKLDDIQAAYDRIATAIQDVTSAMQDMTSASSQANAAAAAKKGTAGTAGAATLAGATGGNFPSVAGVGAQIRTDWSDQSAEIDKLTADLQKKSAEAFANIDMFGGIKKKWNEFKGWWSTNVTPIFQALGQGAKDAVNGVDWASAFKPFQDAWGWVSKVGKSLGKLFGPAFQDIWRDGKKGIKQFWDEVKPALNDMKDLIEPLKKLWDAYGPAIKIALGVLIGAILAGARVFLDIIGNIIGPFFQWVGALVRGILKIIKGVVEGVVALFTGDWALAWQGFVDVVVGVWDIIWGSIKFFGKLLWGLVKGVVEGIWGFFKWLYDELVGHSIVPDIVNGIIAVFKWLVSLPKWVWDHVLKPIYDFFKTLWDKYLVPAVTAIINGIKWYWAGLKALAQWIWDNVLKPIYNTFKGAWDNYIKPAVQAVIDGIKSIWNGLIGLSKWIWENVLRPVWNTFRGAWTDYIKPAVNSLFNGIKTAFSDAVTAIGKIWGKITSTISGPITSIKKWINDNLIDPLNKVVKLFGITIPKMSTSVAIDTTGHGSTSAGRLAGGGPVRGSSPSATADNIPIWATANEYMQPVSAVKYYGVGLMDAIRKKKIPKEAFSGNGFFLGGLIDKGMSKIDGWLSNGAGYAIDHIMDPGINLIGKAFSKPEFVNKAATGSLKQVKDVIKKYVNTQTAPPAGTPAGGSGGAGVERWRGTAMSALLAAGSPVTWINSLLRRMNQESGGNPNAINLWDSNAKAGHPSQGLMQTIPGTFNAYAGQYRSRGILDPFANIYAAIKYTVSRYGSGPAGWDRAGGYRLGGLIGDMIPTLFDNGGMMPPGLSLNLNKTNKPEPVFANNDWRTMQNFVKQTSTDGIKGNSKSGDTIININGDLSFPNVTSGDDVNELIDDLKVLSGDYK